MKYAAIPLLVLAGLIIAGCGAARTSRPETFGKAIPAGMTPTPAREITDNPADFDGSQVLVEGTVTSECPAGGWVWVRDETGDIYVNMHPTNVFIPQRVGRKVRALGTAVLEDGAVQVVGYGLEFR